LIFIRVVTDEMTGKHIQSSTEGKMKVTTTGVYHPETRELLAVEFAIGSFEWFYDFTDSFDSKLRLGKFPCRGYLDKPGWFRGHLIELDLEKNSVAQDAMTETLNRIAYCDKPVKCSAANTEHNPVSSGAQIQC
jgi:hypothetical protein